MSKLPSSSQNQPAATMKSVSAQPPHFDYLSLKSIIALSQTCNRMHRIAAYYFRENFSAIPCSMNENKFTIFESESINLPDNFCQFISSMNIDFDFSSLLNADRFTSLKSITLFCIDFDECDVSPFQKGLNCVENVSLSSCSLVGDLYEKFLKYFPKIKSLSFGELHSKHQKYPMLQKLNLFKTIESECVALKQLWNRIRT